MTPATAMLLSERVAHGEFVVIAGDRVPVSPEPRVAMAPFLGSRPPFPVGPYVLAIGAAMPDLPDVLRARAASAHEVHFEQLERDACSCRARRRDAALAALAAAYAARLRAPRACARRSNGSTFTIFGNPRIWTRTDATS